MPEPLRATPGRLDVVVAALTGTPRADVQRAIAAGRVLVDGSTRPKAHRLTGGERLDVDLAVADAPVGDAEGPEVPIRYRDDHLAVVAKPAGMITHPTPSRPAGTLVNRLLGMGIPLAPAGGPWRPGIVHRLDAGTSGLLVVASTDEAYTALRGVFRRHAADRRYVAMVLGDPAHDRFTVDAPLGRRDARIVVDRVEGRAATTVFDVTERFGAAAIVAARPMTGRTHQIRAHLAAIGHPIAGDRRYGGGGELARALGLERPFLHAAALAFDHPVTAARVDREEPLPEDLVDALARARRDLRP